MLIDHIQELHHAEALVGTEGFTELGIGQDESLVFTESNLSALLSSSN